jgi:hypothetical protein
MNDEGAKLLLEYGNRLNALVVKAQEILSAAIEPEGMSREEAINELLGLLDGPEQREAQAGWSAAVSKGGANVSGEA